MQDAEKEIQGIEMQRVIDLDKEEIDIKQDFDDTAIDLCDYDTEEETLPTATSEGGTISGVDLIDEERSAPVEIIIKNVGVTVKVGNGFAKKVERTILQGVTAVMKPGEMIAIMGSSGSGKTTLLNALVGRCDGRLEGEVLVNGKESLRALVDNSAYVQQYDVLLSNLTVQETLNYAGMLRLPKTYTKEKKQQIIDSLINQMNIAICRNTFIGSHEKKGISGGQKKRVAIAQELLTNPSILLLDEPTSGLDSATAGNLTKSLRKLAQQGKTVIATIHQPSAQVFLSFDKLILLAAGKQVYFGDPKKVVDYLANLGYSIPPLINPADFIMDLTTTGYKLTFGKKEMESKIAMAHLIEEYPKYAKEHNLDDPIPSVEYMDLNLEKPANAVPPSEFYKYGVLVRRALKQDLREPSTTYIRLMQNIFFGLLMGALYFRVANVNAYIRNKLGGLYFVGLQTILTTMVTQLFNFPGQREFFLREESNSAYGVLAYYFAKITAELPFHLFFPFIFSPIFYFMFGLVPDAGKFFIFTFNVVLITHTTVAFVDCITSGVGNFRISLILAPMFYVPFNLLAGYLIKPADIPAYLAWFRFLTPFKHGYEIFVVNEFKDLEITCLPTDLVGGICPITSGDQVISINTDPGSAIWKSFLLQLALASLFHIISIVGLKLSSRKPRV